MAEESNAVNLCDAGTHVEQKIFVVRGEQVMLDMDLARIYGIENRALKQAVRRNLSKFPEDFMFRLSDSEANELISSGVSRFVIPEGYNTGGSNIFAFTEPGTAMLATILRSERAIQASILIMRAFVAMRRHLASNAIILHRLDVLDRKQLVSEHNIEKLFSKFEEGVPIKQGIFYDGQSFDAYSFVSDLIRSAKNRIVLIDNYVDDTVLKMLDKRGEGVIASIFTSKINPTLRLDIDKHNLQYPPVSVEVFKNSHDRFLIVDNDVYHFGASIKDLAKKWFAVALMTEIPAEELITRMATTGCTAYNAIS